jgi:hypothetical protein
VIERKKRRDEQKLGDSGEATTRGFRSHSDGGAEEWRAL